MCIFYKIKDNILSLAPGGAGVDGGDNGSGVSGNSSGDGCDDGGDSGGRGGGVGDRDGDNSRVGSGARPQQDDLRVPGSPSGQGAGGGARTRDRKVSADLRADSLATEPPTPQPK
ncbi:hypothetical protein PoB_003973200 [Plakobranchus ocellatus]|uniref:Uncharacterized protein n=1 Tax=Plakobranchus ocellatus TaxID=259542 RepID=A0AAV4B1X7_9GAST|nr:hypothetical protein PoB_003973200 [Plakobranchus ocellatus]